MPAATTTRAGPPPRAYWLKKLVQWHWISAALSLVGILLFSLTGITLNHAAQISAKPQVTRQQATLPPALRESLAAAPPQGHAPMPQPLRDWLSAQWSLSPGTRDAEWTDGEAYLSLPRPGGDAWVSVDLDSGEVEYERTERGWISYFNDLHKGRNAGAAWSWFIDIFAVACLAFSITGLVLLQLHAWRRPMTWPVVGLGLLIPVLLALLFIH